MTLPRLYAMYKHWNQYPPVHVSVAMYLGIGKSDEKSKPIEDINETVDYIESMPTMKILRPT